MRVTVCHRRTPEAIHSLRGAGLHTVDAAGVREQTIKSLAVYERTLRERFGLEVEGVEALWAKVWASHVDWMANQKSAAEA